MARLNFIPLWITGILLAGCADYSQDPTYMISTLSSRNAAPLVVEPALTASPTDQPDSTSSTPYQPIQPPAPASVSAGADSITNASTSIPTDVPPTPSPAFTCIGKFAFGYSSYKSVDLYTADAWCGEPRVVPDDVGNAIDSWVNCDFSWSPDGTQLLYSTDYSYAGHGEIRSFNAETGEVRTLIPSNALLDTATGQVLAGWEEVAQEEQSGCPTTAAACQKGVIVDGKIVFINSAAPVWSPDGSQILFQSMNMSGQPPWMFGYFLVNRDGGEINSVSSEEANRLITEWSAQRPLLIPPPFNYVAGGVSGYSGGTTSISCPPVWHP